MVLAAGIITMSSFFTVPASQRNKRKRDDRAAAPATKKRGVDGKSDGAKAQRPREREESISGSDLDEDEEIESAISGEDSESDSDDDETAADRRLKLAERYLDNIRDEVDEVGFDAADIDRDLIAERLKEDVVCEAFLRGFGYAINRNHRMNSKDELFDKLPPNSPFLRLAIHSSVQIPRLLLLSLSMRHLFILFQKTKP